MSDIDFKAIEEDAKRILNDFSKALDKVKVKDSGFYIIEKKVTVREDSEPVDCKDFREKWFRTAPKTKKDYLQTEKGDWI